MAVDYLDIFLSFIHLTGAFIWIGAVLYMEIIFKPVLNKLEPPVRSTVMRNLIPRQSKILMAALMVTGISGMVRAILIVPTPSFYTSSAWGWGILGGGVASVLMALIGFLVIMPAGKKMLAISAAGPPPRAKGSPPGPPPEIAKLQSRIENASMINFILSFFIIFAMAVAG